MTSFPARLSKSQYFGPVEKEDPHIPGRVLSMPPRPPVESSFAPPPETVPGTAVREQLTRIVSSGGFSASTRLCRFLTHVVNRTLDGDLESLKEFSIAMEVFDRTTDYDPNVDAIVRVEARRLRAKLKEYYENAKDPVLIVLRPGSYVPTFRWSVQGGTRTVARHATRDARLRSRCCHS